jgi:hypothetical protein
LLTVTEPTETATAAAFAHTAVLAGRPGNAAPLAEAGRLFGRLAHLLDAVEDRETDAASGAWNPLSATGTSLTEARRLADDALHGIRLALREAEFTDGRLAHVLLAHELGRSVDRAFGTSGCGHAGDGAHGPHGALGSPGSGRLLDAPGSAVLLGPEGSFGPPQHGGNPYTGGGNPFGGGPSVQPPNPGKRGFWAGCAAAVGLCCTCKMCCADQYEGPWSRKKREGCLNDCDCDCGCCEACKCCECCECCECCDCGL